MSTLLPNGRQVEQEKTNWKYYDGCATNLQTQPACGALPLLSIQSEFILPRLRGTRLAIDQMI